MAVSKLIVPFTSQLAGGVWWEGGTFTCAARSVSIRSASATISEEPILTPRSLAEDVRLRRVFSTY